VTLHVCAVLILPVALAACTKVGTTGVGSRHSYTIPHVLRYATGEDVAGLNTHLYNSAITVGFMSALTAAWLTKTGPHNEPVPELATVIPSKENGGVSRDGKTITWHLRKGVVWSDGVPFDADDVVFSTKAVLDPANNELSRDGWDLITKIEEPDKYTVVYHLKHPYGYFAYLYFSSAGTPSVLPRHLLAGLPNINHAAYNALPVGIGPFKYAQWKRSDFVEMVANSRYFRGKPRLQRIVFKIVTNPDTILGELQSHELDLWPITATYYWRARALPGVSTQRYAGYNYAHLDFNFSHPVLKELAVRQALRLAIDRPLINRKIFHSLGLVQDDMISPANPAFDPHVPNTPFDLAAANRLLDRAGWVRRADGVRTKGSLRLALLLPIPAGVGFGVDQMSEMIRAWYRQIGVELDVKRYPPAMIFVPYDEGGILNTGKFDLMLWGTNDNPQGDLSNYRCSAVPPRGGNYARYCNHAVDAALDAFEGLYTFRERQPYANYIQEQLQRDPPTIVLAIGPDFWAYNSDLKGLHSNQVSRFDDFMNVDI
jgi:peptide/nickel transport system substrate-binding protein